MKHVNHRWLEPGKDLSCRHCCWTCSTETKNRIPLKRLALFFCEWTTVVVLQVNRCLPCSKGSQHRWLISCLHETPALPRACSTSLLIGASKASTFERMRWLSSLGPI